MFIMVILYFDWMLDLFRLMLWMNFGGYIFVSMKLLLKWMKLSMCLFIRCVMCFLVLCFG